MTRDKCGRGIAPHRDGRASADTVRSCTLRVDKRNQNGFASTTRSRRKRTASVPTSGTACELSPTFLMRFLVCPVLVGAMAD